MEKTINNLLLKYCESEEKYYEFINSKTKTEIIDILKHLLNQTLNDKNSSNLREQVTCSMSGYVHNKEKLGYDGYKVIQKSNKYKISDSVQYAEIKPKNIQKRKDGTLNSRLRGDGNFTDFSWSRLEKITKNNLKMICSGFSHGKILFILEFNFNEATFVQKLTKQLEKRFPNKKDITGQWLRSAYFSFKDYENTKSLKIIHVSKKINKYKDQISLKLYDFLSENKT